MWAKIVTITNMVEHPIKVVSIIKFFFFLLKDDVFNHKQQIKWVYEMFEI